MMGSKLVSYSCRGLGTNISKIEIKPDTYNLFCNDQLDFLCLQETFLTKQDLSFLNGIHPDYHGIGAATTDASSGLIAGHPPGGVAIFWRTSYDRFVSPLQFNSDWIVGIQINIDQKRYTVLNVYMPCENKDHADQYLSNLGQLQTILEELDSTCVFIVGDFNADINNPRANFGSFLKEFCSEAGLRISSQLILPGDTFTFLSDVWNTTSWLDHCLCTSDAHDAIINMCVDYNGAVSDHFPVHIEIDLVSIPSLSGANNNINPRLDWSRLHPDAIDNYTRGTESLLQQVNIPTDALACHDASCCDPNHKSQIDKFYCAITNTTSTIVDAKHQY